MTGSRLMYLGPGSGQPQQRCPRKGPPLLLLPQSPSLLFTRDSAQPARLQEHPLRTVFPAWAGAAEVTSLPSSALAPQPCSVTETGSQAITAMSVTHCGSEWVEVSEVHLILAKWLTATYDSPEQGPGLLLGCGCLEPWLLLHNLRGVYLKGNAEFKPEGLPPKGKGCSGDSELTSPGGEVEPGTAQLTSWPV